MGQILHSLVDTITVEEFHRLAQQRVGGLVGATGTVQNATQQRDTLGGRLGVVTEQRGQLRLGIQNPAEFEQLLGHFVSLMLPLGSGHQA